MSGMQTATLAGGCFWCLEAVFVLFRGVEKVVSGYMGGHVDHPTYEQVCGGDTGHAEAVRISFDSATITYPELLEIFFAVHDPTTPDRQGNDVGSQYRSVIFWHSEEQKSAAEEMIARLAAERHFDAPIVTELRPAVTFWPAEDYHQDYFRDHPRQPYCQIVVSPKVAKIRAKFADRLKTD